MTVKDAEYARSVKEAVRRRQAMSRLLSAERAMQELYDLTPPGPQAGWVAQQVGILAGMRHVLEAKQRRGRKV